MKSTIHLKFWPAILFVSGCEEFRVLAESKSDDTVFLNPEVLRVAAITIGQIREASKSDVLLFLEKHNGRSVFIYDKARNMLFSPDGWVPLSNTRALWGDIGSVIALCNGRSFSDSTWLILCNQQEDAAAVVDDFKIDPDLEGSFVRIVDACDVEHIGKYGIVREGAVRCSYDKISCARVEVANPYGAVVDILKRLGPPPDSFDKEMAIKEWISDVSCDMKDGKAMFSCSFGYEEGFLMSNYRMLLIIEELLRIRSSFVVS